MLAVSMSSCEEPEAAVEGELGKCSLASSPDELETSAE